MQHNELTPEFQCHGDLICVTALSTKLLTHLWCANCGKEFTYLTDSGWVWIVYPGMQREAN